MQIPNIELKDGNKIPMLGLGTWQLTGKKCEETVKDAISLGYKLIDTAEIYGNHKEIGHAIRNADRKKLFITSKVWHDNLKYDDVIKACNETLKDLGTDYLDLYLIHWPNRSVDIKETLKAMKKLKDDGKIRSIGVSNFTIELLKEAIEVNDVTITVNQVEFHPYLYQKELLEFCKLNRIVLTAYSPLARGRVFSDKGLIEIGRRHNKNAGQVVLRWLLDQDVVVIPKASNLSHLKSNLDVFDFKLSDKDLILMIALNKDKRIVNTSLANIYLSSRYAIKNIFFKK